MEAEARIVATMPRAPSPSSEVVTAIRKAYAAPYSGTGVTARPMGKPKPLPMTRETFIRRGDGADESAWWEASPYRIDWEPGPLDAVHLLDALYPPDAFLFCGERFGAEVRTAREWREKARNNGWH